MDYHVEKELAHSKLLREIVHGHLTYLAEARDFIELDLHVFQGLILGIAVQYYTLLAMTIFFVLI
jgi:hypothetical protein